MPTPRRQSTEADQPAEPQDTSGEAARLSGKLDGLMQQTQKVEAALEEQERMLQSILEHLDQPHGDAPSPKARDGVRQLDGVSEMEQDNGETSAKIPGRGDQPFDSNDSGPSLGLLRFEVNGRLAVGDLTRWMDAVQSAYMRLNLFLSPEFDLDVIKRVRFASQEPVEEALAPLMAAAARQTSELWVSRLAVNSPGFWEIVGNLNPIKAIGDIITNWRIQNTQRERDIVQAERDVKIAEIKAQADREIARLKSESTVEIARVKALADYEKTLAEAETKQMQAKLKALTELRHMQSGVLTTLVKTRADQLAHLSPDFDVQPYVAAMFDQPQAVLADVVGRDVRVTRVAAYSAAGLVAGAPPELPAGPDGSNGGVAVAISGAVQ
jgi:hypothetical protein